MWSNLRQAAVLAPLTTGCILLSAILYGMAEWTVAREHIGLVEAQNLLGGVGMHTLWRGDVWRIPVSAFHHSGGLVHLAMNCLAAWHLGRLLEFRLGFGRFAAFLVGAVMIPMLAAVLVDSPAFGFSGAVYAMFGVLWAGRRRDEFCATYITDSVVKNYVSWLFICIVLTYSNVLLISNSAHFSGVVYGYAFGMVMLADWRTVRWARWVFWFAHLAVFPTVWLVAHPIWNGNYYWFLADEVHDQNDELREQYWRRAVELDPHLDGPWHNIALTQSRRGEHLAAWKTMLTGLQYNRAYAKGIEMARDIWRRIPAAQRDEALHFLRETFGGDSTKPVEQWEISLTSDSLDDRPT
ncbi:MAG: rhomboid family intramembrane serine protease [Planctomycetales bacterium]|nr:rhomboid family intramembrane serine protease [Planctomycetales bacterium]